MTARPLPVIATLLAALAVLVVVGARVLERDRDALFDNYGHQRQLGVQEAARGIEEQIADVGQDLDLAATLLEHAETTEIAERELHAIATIKREYMVIYAQAGDQQVTRVTAFDAPHGVDVTSRATLDQMLALARAKPGPLHVSAAYAPAGDQAAWYRVFARGTGANGPAVAIAVDMAFLLGRLKLSADPAASTAILDARGIAAQLSDPELAAMITGNGGPLHGAITAARAGVPATMVIDADVARAAGLPDTSAVAIVVPFIVDSGPPWVLVRMASTITIQNQERTVVRRVVVGGALVLLLLLSAAAYVIRSSYRARALRERLRNADRLAHLTEKAEKILDHIPSGVIALAEDRTVSAVNRWLAERLGRDITGESLEDAFATAAPDEVARIGALVDAALATREPQFLHRERVDLLGAEAALNIHAVPLAHTIHDVSVLLVFDDLTEMRRIEQRLLHSEKLVTAGQLAAGIAHEVGTPLNVARGRMELTLSHLGKEHAESGNQNVAIEQIDRVTRLLQQLLDYVRPAPVALQDIDLAQTLRAVAGLLEPQAGKRGVALEIDAAPHLPPLHADPDQVQQIVVNLVLNAIDACERGGRVRLCSLARDGALVVEIADTGQGIALEQQKQVFDPFFTTKKRGQGTGLGLWVVAQLVRAQSAEIELDSEPGEGTTMRVVWPRAR